MVLYEDLNAAGFRIKSGMTGCGEAGRSMVEMLGVLAIIGTLSVVGVALYGVAMDKHQANTLLNEAQKRAVFVSVQALQNNEPFSVSEFTNPDTYVFGAQKNSDNPDQFQITLKTSTNTSIDPSICRQIKNIVGNDTYIRKINNDCSLITYNNDLSSTLYATDYNGDKDACENAGKKYCSKINVNNDSGLCSEKQDCCDEVVVSQCKSCDSLTGKISGNYILNYKACDFNNDGDSDDGYCFSGNCVALGQDVICNEDDCSCPEGRDMCNVASGICCPTGKICSKSGSNAGTCQTTTSGCTVNSQCQSDDVCPSGNCFCKIDKNNAGSCQPVGTVTKAKSGTKDALVAAGFSEDMILGPKMTWLAAKNWCLANHKKLLDISNNRLQCYPNSTGLCCIENTQNCGTNSTKSVQIRALISSFSFWGAWTNTDHPTGNSALDIRSTAGVYYDNKTNDENFSVLCE